MASKVCQGRSAQTQLVHCSSAALRHTQAQPRMLRNLMALPLTMQRTSTRVKPRQRCRTFQRARSLFPAAISPLQHIYNK